VAGWVAANGVPVVVNDVQNDPRWTTRVDTRSDFVTRHVVAVPLLHQGRLVGVLEGINKKDGTGSPFSTADPSKFLPPKPPSPSKTPVCLPDSTAKKIPCPLWSVKCRTGPC
jgi:hypothetical protein